MTQVQVGALDRYFAFSERETSARTEVLAGFTTFLTMAYIVLVNPAILGQAGMPVASVAAATCFAAAFASILMGLVANTPLALAPGMGLNAYFSFTVVQQMGVPWPVALGCVLISGVAFLLLTLTGVRQLIVSVIPNYLFAAVAGGIGLFIGFIGLKNAGIVVSNPATIVALGDLKAPGAGLALFGLLLIATLSVWNVRAAMLIGIVATTLVGWVFGQVTFHPEPYSLAALTGTAFKLDLPGVFGLSGKQGLGLVEILFVFDQARRPDGCRRAYPGPQPHFDDRRGCNYRRLAGWYQHRHQLCRKRGRGAGGRTHRIDRRGHRLAVSDHDVRGTLCATRAAGGDCAGADHRRRANAAAVARNRMG